jgi:hypothetical protein
LFYEPDRWHENLSRTRQFLIFFPQRIGLLNKKGKELLNHGETIKKIENYSKTYNKTHGP